VWSAGEPAASRQINSLPEVWKLWWIGKPQAITDHLARRPKFQKQRPHVMYGRPKQTLTYRVFIDTKTKVCFL